MEDILDYEEKPTMNTKPRYGAYLLEGIPVALSFLFLLLDRKKEFFFVAFTLSLIYIFFGWYLFKTDKHKWYNILIATIAGLFLAIVIIGPIFHVMAWEGQTEMLIAGTLTVVSGLIVSFIVAVFRTIISKNRKMERGMSWKIFSRFFILYLIYALTDMSDALLNLYRNLE